MTTTLSRLRFLRRAFASGSVAAIAPGLAGSSPFARTSVSPSIADSTPGSAPSDVTAPAIGNLNLNVARIETTWLNVPMRTIPARRMVAENYEWTYFQVHKVTLACGIVGFGEIMPYYTWGRPTEETLSYARGRNATELLWEDFRSGRLPIFVKGVRFEAIENNGSREWKELQDRARKGNVFSKQRIL